MLMARTRQDAVKVENGVVCRYTHTTGIGLRNTGKYGRIGVRQLCAM